MVYLIILKTILAIIIRKCILSIAIDTSLDTKLIDNFWIDLLKYNLAYDANNLTKTDIAKNFLEQNFANSNLNIDTIAEQIGYSKYHLCKTFHKQFGISPMKYLQNLRSKNEVETDRWHSYYAYYYIYI